MNDIDKLRVMLPHWIDHNQGHGGEFAQWAEKLTADFPEVARLLHDAVHSLQKAQSCLEEALNKAGGALEAPGGPGEHQHKHGHNHKHSHDNGQSHGESHDSDDGHDHHS